MGKSRWLDWEPGTSIMEDPLGEKPTKPTKPGSVGFEGSIPGKNPIIRRRHLDGQQGRACDLGNAECRNLLKMKPVDSGVIWRSIEKRGL